MGARGYIIRTIVSTLGVIALVLGFNAFVDPYGIVGATRVEGINANKVDINLHTRQLKRYQPAFARYDALLAGKSRVEMGLDPEHRCLASLGLSTYNIGVPGATLDEQLAYTLNVIYQQDIRTLVMAVDFTDFIATSPPVPRASLFDRMSGDLEVLASGQSNPDFLQVRFMDYLKALFSVDATVSSVKTLLGQGPMAPDRTDRGFNPGGDFAQIVAVEGPRALFDQKIVELLASYGRPWYLRDASGRLPQAFDDFERFLDVLAERDIQVHLFVSPLHDNYWQVMRDNGHMTLYSDWLATMQQRLAARGDTRLRFWDFSGDSPYIHEALPAAGELVGPLDWFWEPSHYRRELGDLILDTLLAEDCGTNAVFGSRLL